MSDSEVVARARTLLGFMGHYILVVMRSHPTSGEETERDPDAFVGILANTDASVLTLAGASKVHYRTRAVENHLLPSFVGDACPLMISFRVASLQRIAKCREASLAPLMRDPRRLAHGAALPIFSDAATIFFVRVMVRRYCAVRMLDRIIVEEGHDPVLQLEEAISEAVGCAPPNTDEPVSRFSMPLTVYVAQAIRSLTMIPARDVRDQGVTPPAPADVVLDQSPLGGILGRVPAVLGTTRVATLREWLRDDSGVFRSHFKPRRKSPTTRVLAITDRYVRACFLITVLSAIAYCVVGGVMVGAAISGPVTNNTSLETRFAGFMWYMLIPVGLVMAFFGIYQSSQADSASMPASLVARSWQATEVFIAVIGFPGFVFGVWFLTSMETPRAEYSTPEAYWDHLANTSDPSLCAFMQNHGCSGWNHLCYTPGATSGTLTLWLYPDCPADCQQQLSPSYLVNPPTQTCSSALISILNGVSNDLLGFYVAFILIAIARNVSLILSRRYFARRVRDAFPTATFREPAEPQEHRDAPPDAS